MKPGELCHICTAPTERVSAGDGSIYRCGGILGPLCEECNELLNSEAKVNQELLEFLAEKDKTIEEMRAALEVFCPGFTAIIDALNNDPDARERFAQAVSKARKT